MGSKGRRGIRQRAQAALPNCPPLARSAQAMWSVTTAQPTPAIRASGTPTASTVTGMCCRVFRATRRDRLGLSRVHRSQASCEDTPSYSTNLRGAVLSLSLNRFRNSAVENGEIMSPLRAPFLISVVSLSAGLSACGQSAHPAAAAVCPESAPAVGAPCAEGLSCQYGAACLVGGYRCANGEFEQMPPPTCDPPSTAAAPVEPIRPIPAGNPPPPSPEPVEPIGPANPPPPTNAPPPPVGNPPPPDFRAVGSKS